MSPPSFNLINMGNILHDLLIHLVPQIANQLHRLPIHQDLTAAHGHLYGHVPVGGSGCLSIRIPDVLRPQSLTKGLHIGVERPLLAIARDKEGVEALILLR